MATFTNGPGVYINESALNALSQPTIGDAAAAAFFGTAERGPSGATLITDWNSYKSLYGELNDAYDLGYAVYHYFNNGGRRCYVVRVTAAAAAKAIFQDVVFYPSGSGNASAALMDIHALSEGAWGNDITVSGSAGDRPSTSTSYGTFNVIVNYKGVEVERWTELSIDPNSNRYVQTVLNTYSQYIRAYSVNPSSVGPSVSAVYTFTADLGSDDDTTPGTVGTNGTITSSDYEDAFDEIDVISGNLILNAVGVTDSSINSLIAKAESRGDSFVLIDPSKAAVTPSTITTTDWTSTSSYAAYYAPVLKMVDPAKSGIGAVRDTYPCGAVAGVIVRTDAQRTVAKAPAGFSSDIRGALGSVVNFTPAQYGNLYDGSPHVNVLKTVPGGGVIINGARTLGRLYPDKFITVRRTLNYVKHSLKGITEFAVFEPNDSNLWDMLTMRVQSFLAEFYRAGGLKGATPSQSFYVKCDATNNNAVSIDQGIVNIEVGVALLTPAEYIVINISQWTGGSNAVDSL